MTLYPDNPPDPLPSYRFKVSPLLARMSGRPLPIQSPGATSPPNDVWPVSLKRWKFIRALVTSRDRFGSMARLFPNEIDPTLTVCPPLRRKNQTMSDAPPTLGLPSATVWY